MTVQIDRLSNGVRLVTEHMPSMASASIGIWVSAGGRHERVDQNGIAHFLEHMAFKGTAKRTSRQIAEAIEDVGGHINAYTSRETTAYYARVLEADVALALDVLADIVLNPVFAEEEIETERHVILQEIGQALDTPDDIVFDWLQEAAFPGQPMGRSILGPAERVSSFGRADLTGFVEERYGPDQIIVSAAGAVDHDALLRQVEKVLGHLTPHGRAEVEPAKFARGERRENKALEQVHVTLALEGPGYCDSSIYTAQIFASALGGGMSSRLFQEIREKYGLCYSIFSQASAFADTGMTMIYAGTSGEDAPALIELTTQELRRAAEDMSDAELTRARNQMKAGLLMGLESPSSRAERLARLLAIWDRVPSLQETIDHIDAVTTADLRAHAAALIGSDKLAMALYGPLDGVPSLEEVSQRLAA